jgi:peroxiredoxin
VAGPTRPAASAGTGPTRPAANGTGARPAASTAPRRAGKPSTSRPVVKTPSKTLRPLDLALITVGIVVVGALIWFGLGGLNSNTPNANNSTSGAVAGTTPAAGAQPPADPTLEAIFNNYNQTPVPAGADAPAFTWPGVDGKTYSLSDYKGKVVLVEFMATWCPHCQEDAPIMNQLYEAYKDKNVQILAVNASPWGHKYNDGDDSRVAMADLTWFRDTYQVAFPMLFDQNVQSASAYGVTRFPTIFVVDANGKIAAQIENPPTLTNMSAALDKALAGGSAAPPAQE